jgi:hypothetical protein
MLAGGNTGATTFSIMTLSIKTLSIMTLSKEDLFATFSTMTLSIIYVIMLSVITLSVIMLSVVILSVVAPSNAPIYYAKAQIIPKKFYNVCPWQNLSRILASHCQPRKTSTVSRTRT